MSNQTKLLRRPAVMDRYGLTCSTLYAKIAAGKFPAPVHPFGCRLSYWVEAECEAALRAAITAERVPDKIHAAPASPRATGAAIARAHARSRQYGAAPPAAAAAAAAP